MTSLALALLILAMALSWGACGIARAVGRRMNAMDGAGVEGQIKAASRRVPNTGGIGIFLAIAGPLLLGLWLFRGIDASPNANWRHDLSFIPADTADHVAGIQQRTPDALILLGCLLVLHVIGLIDDRRPLGPAIKLIIMLATAATIVLATDTRLLTFLSGYGPLAAGAAVALTIAWIVVITNAFNFLDNMDGLSAGVAVIAATFFLIAALVAQQLFVASMLGLLIGALLGFLRYNFPFKRPGATLFMGDSGSLIVGFLIAVLSVRITYLPAAQALSPPGLTTSSLRHFLTSSLPLLTPLIILAIPLYDFGSVCTLRIRQGRSPFVGDLQHFSHRLVNHGLSRRAAVIVIYGCTAVTGIGAVALPRLAPWQAVLVGVQTILVLLVIALYEWSRPQRSTTEAMSAK